MRKIEEDLIWVTCNSCGGQYVQGDVQCCPQEGPTVRTIRRPENNNDIPAMGQVSPSQVREIIAGWEGVDEMQVSVSWHHRDPRLMTVRVHPLTDFGEALE